MRATVAVAAAFVVSADAYMLAAPACARVQMTRTAQPDMVFGKLKKLLKRKEDPSVAAFRSNLAGMEQLADLKDLKLEREEGREARKAGVWKEYVKADGRKWYYNTDTKKQTWVQPEEFKKLDEISAAAAAKNEERGA
jgi:hypothetical protein